VFGDHLLQVFACVALSARELHEFREFAADLALGGRADDSHTPPRAHFEEPT
jgi:hypothetical protein